MYFLLRRRSAIRNSIVKKIPIRHKLFYGAGNLGISFTTQTLVGFIMFFGTAVMKIDGTLMGVAFTIGIVWDAVSDPLTGRISDRTNSRLFGRRHGFILFGTLMLAAANIFLWCLPLSISTGWKFVWMLVGILVFQTCSTIINVPYNALALDLSKDYNEQTDLQGIKAVFFLLGIIMPIVIMPVLESSANNGRYDPLTYRNLAIIGSIVLVVSGLITFFGTRSHIPHLNKKARLNSIAEKKLPFKKIIKNFVILFKDVNYRSIIIGLCATSIASAFLTGMGMHVFTFTFKLEGFNMYLVIGELFGVIILSQPLWLYICKKIGKKPALMNGLKIAAVGLLLFVLMFIFRSSIKNPSTLLALLTIPIVIVGLGIGSTYLIPQAMIADVIAYNSKNEEANNNATIMGYMTFSHKMAQAITLLIIGFMLDIIGFNSNAAETGNYVPDRGVENGLGIVLLIGLGAGLGLALFFINKYKLKKEDIPNSEDEMKKEEEQSVIEKAGEQINA